MQEPQQFIIPEGIQRRDAFVITLAQALHLFGTPAHRLEHAMDEIAKDLGMQLQILATPTSVHVAIGSLEDQRTFLMRVDPADANLDKLADLQTVMQQVSRGELGHGEAKARIDNIVKRRPRYGNVTIAVAFAITSACGAVLFGGSLADALVSLIIGLFIGALALLSLGRPKLSALRPAMSAAVAAILARLASSLFPELHPFIITLASIIVLLPGLSLTMGVNELAHQHLVSGTARLMGSLVVLLQLGLGVAAGWGVANTFIGNVVPSPSADVSLVWVAAAVVAASMAFTVLFQAKPHDFWAVLMGGALSYTAARVGTELYNPEFGAALGAWSMGCLANIIARVRDKPALTTILPGIILLVPGSMGFRSVQALISNELTVGAEAALTTVMVSIALVIGLFLSNLTINPRKLL